MGADFDAMLEEWTKKDGPKVLGAIMKCVDKNGKEIYNKIAGYSSTSADAALLREDAVFKIASSTKLITSIALLQCIERGLIGLDDSLASVLPEIHHKEIVSRSPEGKLEYTPNTRDITPRQLLSHTSGLGYRFVDPVLGQWANETGHIGTNIVAQKYNTPLIYEPGTGWAYGSSLDWAGIAVRRLNNDLPLEDYLIAHVWKPLGLTAPFPTFHLSADPAYKARLMEFVERTPAGELRPSTLPVGDNPDDCEGGAGLAAPVADYVAVLRDLVADAPTLLRPETVAAMFEPQLAPGSKGMDGLVAQRPAWDVVAGPVTDEGVNHGLGGMLVVDAVPEIGQPGKLLAWGGASNTIWFVSRERGVAGYFATQQIPFGAPKELVNAWKKDFWSGYREA